MKFFTALAASLLLAIPAFAQQITPINMMVTPFNNNPVNEIPAGKITITFLDFSTVFCYDNYIEMTADNGESGRYQTWYDGGTRVSILVKEPITKAGVYSFHFPNGSIEGDFNCNESETLRAFDIIYTVTGANDGIEAVQTDAAYDVYTLSGQPVVLRADASALRALPRGFYLVNGAPAYLY